MPYSSRPQASAEYRGIGRRRLLLGSALGTASLLLGRTDPSFASELPLRIGFVGPFTGPAQDTGLEIRRGVLMALLDARDEGELPLQRNGLKRPVEPVWVDSASDPDRAVAAMTEAVTRDRVAMLVGGWHSDVALALMDAESAFQILHLGHTGEAQAIADNINRAYGKYRGWFKGWPSPSLMAARYGEPLQYLRYQGLWRPASNRAAVMVENSAYGRGWGEALRHSLQSVGFQVDPPDLTALEATDFRSLMTRYRRDGVSLVAMTTTGVQAAAAFVRQFSEQEVPALLLGHGLRWTRDWYAYTGNASNYVLTMDSAMPIALWQQWWVRRYRRLFSDGPSIAAAGLHYDYTRMAIRVLNASASLKLDDLIRTVYRMPYRGVWNRYQFASEPTPNSVSANEVQTGGFMEGFFFPMAQLMEGEARIVWPPRYADQRFVPPPWV